MEAASMDMIFLEGLIYLLIAPPPTLLTCVSCPRSKHLPIFFDI